MAYLSSLFLPVSAVIDFDSAVANSTAFSNRLQVKAAAGKLYTVTGFTSAANMQYIHIYNAAAYPPASSPVSVSVVPGYSNFNITFATGLPCSTGILIACSTTPVAFNAAAANTYMTATYK